MEIGSVAADTRERIKEMKGDVRYKQHENGAASDFAAPVAGNRPLREWLEIGRNEGKSRTDSIELRERYFSFDTHQAQRKRSLSFLSSFLEAKMSFRRCGLGSTCNSVLAASS